MPAPPPRTTLAPCLAAAAVTIAVIHTLQGPDHYVPFSVLRKARGWSADQDCLDTARCGIGHCASSVVLALRFAWSTGLLLEDVDPAGDAGGLASWASLVLA
jgi:hypothetical protein